MQYEGQFGASPIDRVSKRIIPLATGGKGECEIAILSDRLVDATDPLASSPNTSIADPLEQHQLRLEAPTGLADRVQPLVAAPGGLLAKSSPRPDPASRDAPPQPRPRDLFDRQISDPVLELAHPRLHEIRGPIGLGDGVGTVAGRLGRSGRGHLRSQQSRDRLETHVPIPLGGESSSGVAQVVVDARDRGGVGASSNQSEDRPSPLDRLAASSEFGCAGGGLAAHRNAGGGILGPLDLIEHRASKAFRKWKVRIDSGRSVRWTGCLGVPDRLVHDCLFASSECSRFRLDSCGGGWASSPPRNILADGWSATKGRTPEVSAYPATRSAMPAPPTITLTTPLRVAKVSAILVVPQRFTVRCSMRRTSAAIATAPT